MHDARCTMHDPGRHERWRKLRQVKPTKPKDVRAAAFFEVAKMMRLSGPRGQRESAFPLGRPMVVVWGLALLVAEEIKLLNVINQSVSTLSYDMRKQAGLSFCWIVVVCKYQGQFRDEMMVVGISCFIISLGS